ncbi:hypothetical protein D3C84_1277820 [compost metagenome]
MLDKCARTTLDSATNSVLPSDTLAGILIRRGKARGACTMAMDAWRPNASAPDSSTMKFRLLL